MPVTIKINGTNLSLVHKFSNGLSIATIPDVCKTPTPGGPVPMPYPNIAQSITLSGGTTTVKGDRMMAANKGSKFALSNGDNAGVAGGVKSSTFMKEATWILYSFTVKLQRKNACRFTDKMFHNSENTANLAGVFQGPVVVTETIGQELADQICTAMCETRKKQKNGEITTKKPPKGKKPPKKPKYYRALQDHVAEQFSNGKPMYVPNKLDVFVEQTWQIAETIGGEFLPVMAGRTRNPATGRFQAARTLPNGNRAPGSLGRGLGAGAANPGGTFRPDFTVLKDPSKACTAGNVKAHVEVKFDGDTDSVNQAKAKKRLGKNKLVTIEEKDCACS
jgi:hypothetical protein